jgi:hypothetical protein
MLFGGAPLRARALPGGFVIWNLKFVIYLEFGACDLEFEIYDLFGIWCL